MHGSAKSSLPHRSHHGQQHQHQHSFARPLPRHYLQLCALLYHRIPGWGGVFVITPPPVPTPLHCISRSKREAKQHRANLLYNHGEADLDGDGEVSSAELATPAKNIASASDERQRAAAEELITNADTNGDGKFSREEFVAAHAARRARRTPRTSLLNPPGASVGSDESKTTLH